ncbi:MAG: Mur ligase domain-containing protein, partial [Streptosporangiaceae bacterium]
MIPLTLGEITHVTGGSLRGDASILVDSEFVIDSRRAVPGALFVAVVGERVDGHDFVQAAMAAGAVAVLGTREVPDDRYVPCLPMVLVE